MPKLARWYAKSAMIYLVVGAIIAALALSQAVPLPPGLLALRIQSPEGARHQSIPFALQDMGMELGPLGSQHI